MKVEGKQMFDEYNDGGMSTTSIEKKIRNMER